MSRIVKKIYQIRKYDNIDNEVKRIRRGATFEEIGDSPNYSPTKSGFNES
jgi:hypothetical protein